MNCCHSPEINSLGIAFLPDVVTRYNVKSSMRNTTHDVINLYKLWRICLVAAASAILLPLPDGVPAPMPPPTLPLSLAWGSRSNGACVGERFGWQKSSNASRNVSSDCCSHNAGGAAVCLYLFRYLILNGIFLNDTHFFVYRWRKVQYTSTYLGQCERSEWAKWNGK